MGNPPHGLGHAVVLTAEGKEAQGRRLAETAELIPPALTHEFCGRTRKYGVKNIHDPKWGAWWDKRTHQLQSHHYNARWEEYLEPHRSVDEITDFARRLASEFNLA